MDDDPRGVEIDAEFDGWHVWMSDTGRWWAARKTSLTAADLSAGCAQYLEAESPQELREQITDEEALGVRLAAERPRRPENTQEASE